jgi:hypothetical protein
MEMLVRSAKGMMAQYGYVSSLCVVCLSENWEGGGIQGGSYQHVVDAPTLLQDPTSDDL